MIKGIEAGLELLEFLQKNIPLWIEEARKKGELTAEQEAGYQARQKAVFELPEAKPRDPEPLPPPS